MKFDNLFVASHLTAKRSWRRIFEKVDLQLRSGDRIFISGENGSGKSTLLETLLGLHPASEGSISWLGRTGSPAEHHAFFQGTAFYLKQHDNLFASLSLSENIQLASPLDRIQRRRKMEEVLQHLPELASALPRRARAVSMGQRQLAACARLAMFQPCLVVLDEPTAGLAPSAMSRLYQLLQQTVPPDAAVLFTEQHTYTALSWATAGYRLADGSLVRSTQV